MKILQTIDQMGIGGIQEGIKLQAKYSLHRHAVRAYMGAIGEEMVADGYWVGEGLPPDIESYDIVQAHGVGGWKNHVLSWARDRGMKTIEVMHSNAKCITPPEWVDALVCLNGIAYDLNKDRFPSRVIPCMIEYDTLPKKPRGHYVGRLSRVVEEKRPDHFVEVARKCPDLEFLLGGDGPALEPLKRKAPSNVHFTGMTRDFPGFYQGLSVFLYPTKDDCCSAVVAMAMASGIPVVTYDIPSMRDVFGDLVWYAQGLDDLHLVLRHVLARGQQVRDKIDLGLEFAKRFDVWNVARQYDQLYQELYGIYDEKSLASYWDLRYWVLENTPFDEVTPFNVARSHVAGAQNAFKVRYAHILEGLGGKLLDVGCGSGHYSVPLKELSPNLHYYGIDTSPMAVKVSKKYATPESVIRLGSATELPYSDNSFDVVMSITCLQHLPVEMRLQAISEMKRVLKPGGLIMMRESADGGGGDTPLFGRDKWYAAWAPEIKIEQDSRWRAWNDPDVWVGSKA